MSDCRHLTPKICGNKLKPFLSDKGCGVPRFVGIEDVTINQGIGIDLTEGVYAYDGNGNEIEYTVTPDSIDMCDVGEHTVIYRAMAEGKKFAPWFCSKQRGLAGDLLCNRVALRKDRTVTIEQIDPPRIEGLDTVKISPNVEFDPTEGVTAIDGNGNEIEYTYSGLADAVAEGAIASFETEFEQNARSVLCDIEPIQSGSGTPSPDNVRPISGHTECVTDVCGVNVWDEEWELGTFNTTTGADVASTTQIRSKNAIPIVPNTQYCFNSAKNIWVLFLDDDMTPIPSGASSAYGTSGNSVSLGGSQKVFTSPTTARFAKFYCQGSYGTTYNHDISINYPSTDHDYHAYQGTTHTTPLGRTVYGGTVDLVSGVLTVDVGKAVLDGSESWTAYPSYNGFYTNAVNMKKGVRQDGVSNMLVNSKNGDAGQTNAMWLGVNSTYLFVIGVYDSMGSTVEDFKSYLSQHNLEVTYPLDTPQTYQLTPTEIALLKGTNNVWCDSGNVRVVYQESMSIGESIEYETVGERIITYTATDVCGNTSEVEREILVGITAQACESQACGAFVYCAPTEACEAIVGLSATACE